MQRSVSNRWLQIGRWLLCTIALTAPVWGGLLLPGEALAQVTAPAPAAPAAAPADAGQGGGSTTVWLLLLLVLVVVVVLFLVMRSGGRTQPSVKKGEAARGWFDPAGRMRNKY